MSAYLKPKHENIEIYNSDDFNYQDEPVTYFEVENRYLKTTGNLTVSYTENIIFEGKINGMNAQFLEGVDSPIQQQIDNIGVNSGGGMFQLVLESNNVNVSNNGSYAFSDTNIKNTVINGTCDLKKYILMLNPLFQIQG